MNDPMLPLSGLSPVAGKKVVVNVDGGLLSSDGGIPVLREVEQRLCVANRMAACLVDPRAPDQITHTLAAIMRFRLLMIVAGYEGWLSERHPPGIIQGPRKRMVIATTRSRMPSRPPDRRFAGTLTVRRDWK